MRILHSWLQQYIDFKLKPEILAEKLGMLGLEIEHFERLDERYSGFVVGKVLSVSQHPNADRLSVCVVDVGDSRVQLVCGAPNVAAGQKVVVGKVGATVPKNQHAACWNASKRCFTWSISAFDIWSVGNSIGLVSVKLLTIFLT